MAQIRHAIELAGEELSVETDEAVLEEAWKILDLVGFLSLSGRACGSGSFGNTGSQAGPDHCSCHSHAALSQLSTQASKKYVKDYAEAAEPEPVVHNAWGSVRIPPLPPLHNAAPQEAPLKAQAPVQEAQFAWDKLNAAAPPNGA